MTSIFLDANVLVSVVNKEYPLFTYSSRILSLASNTAFKVYTSPLCLAIAFYFAEKKHKTILAKQKIALLCQHIYMADNTSKNVSQTLLNKRINDFEDGLEYYAAMDAGCTCMVTEDTDDFYFSEITVLNCKDFFARYLAK